MEYRGVVYRSYPIGKPAELNVPRGLLFLAFAVGSGLLLMRNGLYLFLCFVVVLAMLRIFWRPFQPAIFLFCFVFQWIQVAAYVVWLNAFDKDIDYVSRYGGVAVVEALLGLLLMAAVVRGLIKKNYKFSRAQLLNDAARWDERKLLMLYALATIFLSSIGFVFGNMSGLAQVLFNLQSIKWVFFVVYGYVVWVKGSDKKIFWLISAYEFLFSFYSYFSDFKTVLLYVALLLISIAVRISLKQVILILLSGAMLIFLFVTWSAVKGEYRTYLASGQREQTVRVSRENAYGKIFEQLGELNSAKYQKALTFSLYRVQYVLHLVKVMEKIPAVRKHEDGSLWMENVLYVIKPRAIFPDKGIFDPSIKTNKYTGLKYATGKMGVSFSLGYFAEAYVDFGHVLMFFPLILIAVFVAWIYNFFMSRERLSLLLRYGIVLSVLFPFGSFESDGIFLLGRLFTGTVVFVVLSFLIFPALQKWAYRSE